MRLRDILTARRVTTRLHAEDKASALRALARIFVDDDQDLDEERIAEVFEEREALASTGVGSGVAIPHGRMAGVAALRAVVGISADGVEFESIDGRPAHILVAVLGPERQTGDHLKALARFSRLLRRPTVRERLLAASGADEAYEIIVTEDNAS